MTENQLYPMSADFFETSSNSSNPLKYDLYALGLSNSNSSSNLYGQHLVTLSPPPPANSVSTGATATTLTSTTTERAAAANNQPAICDNQMLTNAISIPRSNNPNSNELHYTSSSQHHHHNHHLQPHHQNQNHQQQQQQQQQRFMADLSEYCLDALDASSLSPTLLQDVSLSAASPINTIESGGRRGGGGGGGGGGGNSATTTPNGNNTSFYPNDDQTSPISNSGERSSSSVLAVGSYGSSSNNGSANGSGSGPPNGDSGIGSHSVSAGSGDGTHNMSSSNNPHVLYEIHQVTANSNTMWSDIGCAIVSTKNEPFSMEDDYIFPVDKTEIQNSSFSDINDETFLEVIGNIEEFIPNGPAGLFLSPTTSNTSGGGSGSEHLQQLSSPQPTGPPHQLLQQHQLQQQQQQHQQHQQQQQAQQHQLQQHHGLLQLQQHPHHQDQQQQHLQQQHNSFAERQASSKHIPHHHHHHHHHSHHHHGSSSPYDIYHSTPNKQHMNSSATFSPGSQTSRSPLLASSVTPSPPHINQRSPYQHNMVKSRNVQDILKKDFSMSPDRSSSGCGSGGVLGPSANESHILLSGIALSPGSSGFGGSAITGGVNYGGGTNCSARRSFGFQPDTTISRLSSSAPTQIGLEQIWLRREPRQHLLSTGSLVEAESFSSVSTGSVLSPDGVDFSQDDEEEGSSDYNSDHYEDFSSDNGSDNDDDNRTTIQHGQMSSSKCKERFFWQYNVQAKGPKGKRLVFQTKLEDPHILNEVTDPVFSPNCSVRGIKVFKHSGKARKGDGNDLTPNPKKLHSIGKELDKLSRTINDMIPVSELPFNVRPKSRKEKNKLASRACRLKKKAQHEANKIKLHGLEIEHKRLLSGISDIKQMLAIKYQNQNCTESSTHDEFDQLVERIYKTALTGVRVAGGTTDFVNKVLDNIKSGVANGGLEDLRKS